MAASQFHLFATKRFLPLFVAQFTAALNDNFFKNALIILMTYKTGAAAGVNAGILVTAAAGVFILPFFLFSAAAGQVADKYDKTRLIRLIRLLEIPLLAVAGIGFFLGHYPLLMTVLFLAGVSAAFFGPLKYSVLPLLLKEGELLAGNALVEAGTFLAILLGTILGGVLILTEQGVFWIAGLMLAFAGAGWGASLFMPLLPAADAGLRLNKNFIGETFRVLRHAARDRKIFATMLGISWFWLTGFTFLAQFPVFARDFFGGDETVVTFFLTLFSVGIALGSLLCNRFLKGKISAALLPLGGFGMTAAIALLWLISPAPLPAESLIGLKMFLQDPQALGVTACLLLIAGFGGIYVVPLYALLQTGSEKNRLSRTIAANNILNAAFMVAGALLTMALLGAGLGVDDVFLATGALTAAVTLFLRRRLLK